MGAVLLLEIRIMAHGPNPTTTRPLRAGAKIAVIVAGLLLLAGLLAMTIDSDALDRLKYDLSLWSLIAAVLVINIVSFALLMVLFFAYQWVRCDLKTPRIEDEKNNDSP